MLTKQIKSIDHLKLILLKENETCLDFLIALNGGAHSRKEIYYHRDTDKFEIFNAIDETTQFLTQKELEDHKSEVTNIGIAIKQKAFYQIL